MRRLSDCCKYFIRIAGGKKLHYECTKCNQPCDIEKNQWKYMTQAEKVICLKECKII